MSARDPVSDAYEAAKLSDYGTPVFHAADAASGAAWIAFCEEAERLPGSDIYDVAESAFYAAANDFDDTNEKRRLLTQILEVTCEF